MRILVDMDGVVSDVHSQIELLHYDTAPGREKITEWDMSKVYPEGRGVFHFFELPDIFAKANPISGSIIALSKLMYAGHEIIFVTAVPSESHNAYYQKLQWIKRYFGIGQDHFVATHRKDLIEGDVLIDDRPSNIEVWLKAHPKGRAFVFSQPWNGGNWDNPTREWERIVREILQW